MKEPEIRKIVFIPLFVLLWMLKGITYLTAKINISLSKIPYKATVLFASVIESVMKLFPPPRLPVVHMAVKSYDDMLKKLETKKYDKLYENFKKEDAEFKKREAEFKKREK